MTDFVGLLLELSAYFLWFVSLIWLIIAIGRGSRLWNPGVFLHTVFKPLLVAIAGVVCWYFAGTFYAP